jgi:hypothetical protein
MMPLHPAAMTQALALSELRRNLYRIQAEGDEHSRGLAGSAMVMLDVSLEVLNRIDRQLKGGKCGIVIHYDAAHGDPRSKFVSVNEDGAYILADGTTDYVREIIERENHVELPVTVPEGEKILNAYREKYCG